jgi:hypothetical protein
VQRFARVQLEVGRSVKLPSGASMWQPLGTSNLSRDQIGALAGSGAIPSGVARLGPGESVSIPLADVSRPSAEDARAAATVSLRIGGPDDWRGVTIRTAPAAFP